MKCPKCKYVSHDYLDVCRKCGVDLVAFKHDMGLLVLQPGVLDLSLVLGEAGADDLFESVEEEATLPATNDDDFDMSLDAPDQAGARRAPIAAPRAGARESAEGSTGLDHLTLELDVSELPAELAAGLRAASAPPEAPATPADSPPAVPEASGLPGHLTLDMGPDSMAIELPSAALAELAALPPPVSETAAPPVERSELAEATAVVPQEQGPTSDRIEVVEPAGGTVDTSAPEAVSLAPVAELTLETAAEAAEMLPELAMPTLDDAALTFTDENVPPTQPSGELTATVDDATSAEVLTSEVLTSADMLLVEDSQESTVPGDLVVELSPAEPDSEQGVTSSEAPALGDLEEATLPGHLTLELDAEEIMAHWSSETLDEVRPDDPSGTAPSKTSPPQPEAGDEEELSLDLDNLAVDDDAPA